MRILLVKPNWPVGYGQVRYARRVRFPPLALGILAALSDGHDVTVVDASVQPVPFHEDFDLVGITVTTFAAPAAYQLAARFRQRGVRVVMGGVHPSLLPQECLEHADAVVAGEAEYVWKELLEDALRGELKEVYRAGRITDLADVPFTRRDLLGENRWFTAVEATRGCPNRCRYCYLPSVPWREHRTRPVSNVLAEVKDLPQNVFIFVDENFFADRAFALELCRSLKPLGKRWMVQAPTTIVDDHELLDAMVAGGCFNVHAGFQSFSREALAAAGVEHGRVESYRRLVRQLHERRVIVTGFFVFGTDADRYPDVFETTAEVIRQLKIDDAGLFPLTPFPGTEYYEQFRKEGRLLEEADLSHFGFCRAVFRPAQMTARELEKGIVDAYQRLWPYFLRRLPFALLKQPRLFLENPRFAAAMVAGNLTRPGLSLPGGPAER